MTTVNLASFFTFPEANKPKEVTLKSVELPIKGPQTGLVTLYGFKDAVEELSVYRLEADRNRLQFAKVEIKVEAGNIPQTQSTMANLNDSIFLNTRRMNKELESKIQEYWSQYLEEDGYDPSKVSWKHFDYMTNFPHYFDRLRNEPEFKHIEMISFPLRDGTKVRHNVALFSYDHVLSVEAKNFPEIKVHMPELPTLAATKKLKM